MSGLEKSMLDHPIFEEAKRRLALKERESIFFVDSNGEIEKAQIRKSGLTPSADFPQGRQYSSTYVGTLRPGVIWGKTEDDVRERISQQESKNQAIKALEGTHALAIPESTVGVIMAEKRLEMQRAAGSSIILNDKGGIDLSDISSTALDVTVRIAHPISAFGVKSMEAIVSEGFIHPILYRVLKEEFDELFSQINALVEALNALKTLPEAALNAMRQALYMSANELTVQFLMTHAELIEFTQLAAVRNGDFAARALFAILDDGKRHREDFPTRVQYFIEKFRPR